MGLPVGNGSEVFPNIEVREISDEELIMRQDYVYQGLDFGFAVDPAAFVRVHYNPRKEEIYFLDEIYVRGWSNKRMAEEIKKRHYEEWMIFCDCAEPKSINDMRDNAVWYSYPCYKAAGCVEYRIKWLQHRKLIFDPRRTPNAYREFSTYSYDIDRNGNVLSQVPDKNNHTIDATAYALNRPIFGRMSSA